MLQFVDPGAESPRETWLRLLLIRASFPMPTTQIPIRNEYGVVVAWVDMGWEQLKIAAEYDGDHHRMDRRQFTTDIHRAEILNELGCVFQSGAGRTAVSAEAEDHSEFAHLRATMTGGALSGGQRRPDCRSEVGKVITGADA